MNETVMREGMEMAMPGSMVAFLRLCLLAGLYNGVALFAGILLRPLPHPPPANITSPFAFHAFSAFLGAVIFLPLLMLPYWLALAFAYSRNEWARVLLYVGAGLVALMTVGLAMRTESGFLAGLGALLPGVAALVCLGRADARMFLRETVPVFVVRQRRY